ncbi:MAG: hypothetical protein VX528_01425 [Candidatus Latescibacterota bacterium]|nr:hypothetical protein [Candidatus Latescibacterota bacterium]
MTTADRERARSLLNKLSQPFDHSRAQIEDAAHVLGSDKGRLYMVMPGQPIHPACLALEALARKYR